MSKEPEWNGSGIPAWWPIVVSSVGMACVVLILVDRINLPAIYPVVGMMTMGGFAAYGDRLLRKRKENGNGGGGKS